MAVGRRGGPGQFLRGRTDLVLPLRAATVTAPAGGGYYWDKLTEGGEESDCGWLRGDYGLSWQVVPAALFEGAERPGRGKAQRATQAMLSMKKLDIATLRRAHAGT